MELKTISDIFDVKLNAFTGGIQKDEYEKSLYLTEAQNIYYNMLLDQFEDNSTVAIKLAKLIVELSISSVSGSTNYGGYIIDLGREVRGVLRDSVQINHPVALWDGKTLSVVEDRLAEIQESLANPFRQPNAFQEMAIRVINESANFSQIQLYLPAGATLQRYFATVATVPVPIILEDLPDGLTIQDESLATQALSFADPEIQDIITLAVSNVLRDMGLFNPQPQEQQK